MSFLNTLDISASALTAERFRMDMIAQNIANIDTTHSAENPDEPYRRRLTVFQERELTFSSALDRAAARQAKGGGVRVARVIQDPHEFNLVYNPSHPDANEEGYVQMPNVDMAEEEIDLMAASHSYNANITAVNVIKAMAMKASEITK